MMKKRVVYFTAFVIVILLSGLYSALALNAYSDQLILKEDMIKGELIPESDISLVLSSRTTSWGSMWDTVVSLDKLDSYSSKYYNEVESDMPLFFELTNESSVRGYGSYSDNEKLDKNKVMKELEESAYFNTVYEKEIIRDMIKHDIKQSDIKLKDYIDYMPLKFFSYYDVINVKNINTTNNSNSIDLLASEKEAYLTSYFKFPVKEDMYLRCKAIYDEQEYDFEIEAKPPYDRDDIISVFTCFDAQSNNLFISFANTELYEIPDEYQGIFVLPLKKEEEKGIDVYYYDESKIQKVYSVDEGETVRTMYMAGNNELCLVTDCGKKSYLSYIDCCDYKSKAKVDISSENKENDVSSVIKGKNGSLVLYDEGNFIWVSDNTRRMSIDGAKYTGNYLKESEERIHRSREHVDTFNTFVFAECNGKLYILNNQYVKAQLTIIDETGKSTVIEYSLPMRKGADEGLGEDIRDKKEIYDYLYFKEEEFMKYYLIENVDIVNR